MNNVKLSDIDFNKILNEILDNKRNPFTNEEYKDLVNKIIRDLYISNGDFDLDLIKEKIEDTILIKSNNEIYIE